jgi:glutamyl-tRNA synthetase
MNDLSTVTASGSDIRVRFCPSPTGTPHVGLIRTALFNWAYSRHTGGTFIFRIEDTDRERDSEDSYRQLLEAMRWLGLDWDEGVEVGGPHGPYRQSERFGIYADVLDQLRAGGYVYESFSTPEEVEARHRAAGRDPKLGYDNADRELSEADRSRLRAEGRSPVLRMRMPDEDLAFTDLIRGTVTFRAGSVPDFVVARADGHPLYTLVNPVDDALMGMTHVLRGEDLLSSMPRQLALYRALGRIGVATRLPRFGHLPYVMGQGNRKLSKRDPESDLFRHREHGFLPEGLLNYLALLGWSIAEDRDVFTMTEMVETFEVTDVNANPARFDLAKAEAINAEHIRRLDESDLAARIEGQLRFAGVLPEEPTARQHSIVAAATPLVQTRMQVLGQAPELLGFLFVADDALEITEDAWTVVSKDETTSIRVLDAARESLAELPRWEASAMDELLRERVATGLGLKPRIAFTPLRVAVSGRRVSPPLWESMEILGRESTLNRLTALRERLGG